MFARYSSLVLLAGIMACGSVSAEEQQDWLKAHNVSLYTIIEVEAFHSKNYADVSGSDVVLATAEFGMSTRLHEMLGVEVSFLYEENETDLEVDVATVTLGPETGFSLTAGQMYVHFGDSELPHHGTTLISDPLTLELSESRETAVSLNYKTDNWHSGFYIFNGDTNNGGEDKIEHYGADFSYTRETAALNFSLGLNYVSSMADTDSLVDAVAHKDKLSDYTGGIGLHGSLSSGAFSLGWTYVTALDSFSAQDLAFKGQGAEPKAWNIEGAYQFKLAGKDAAFGVAWQGTDEVLALELPKTRYLMGVSVAIMKYTALLLEWAHDKDYDRADGGTGESADTFTVQLALEF